MLDIFVLDLGWNKNYRIFENRKNYIMIAIRIIKCP